VLFCIAPYSIINIHNASFALDLHKTVALVTKSLINMAKLKYLRTTVRNQNYIHEEIKNSLNSRNACYHSLQNLLSSRALTKNLKVKIFKTIILPVVLYGYETGMNKNCGCSRTGY
jgi:hypothetical protein